MTDEDMIMAYIFAEELESLMASEEEQIKMEHMLDIELEMI